MPKLANYDNTDLIEILYAALHSPCGIAVACTPNASLARQNLYKARKAAMDVELDCLKISPSPFLPEEEIWITNGKEGKRAPDKAPDPPVSG